MNTINTPPNVEGKPVMYNVSRSAVRNPEEPGQAGIKVESPAPDGPKKASPKERAAGLGNNVDIYV